MLEIYQRLKAAAEADYPEGLDANHAAEQFDESCNCILRALYETDRQAYLDCVAWDMGRLEPPSMRTAAAIP